MRNVALYIAHTPRRHNGAGMCMRLGLIKIALIWYNQAASNHDKGNSFNRSRSSSSSSSSSRSWSRS
ncbi:uncharacterized protein LOC111592293 isoform X2 [Drosophila hydei]|uniref:Uncharacterized protein LOC111592293 isoform X2 n=1 Tax=Drosophila hydei TaxID=7224 RepID=A0A6J2SVT9_DROHY|nr:uncharacterized protein LOC111592293 isoform X2 [Drosophila hydei]